MRRLIFLLVCLLPSLAIGQNLFDANGNRLNGDQSGNGSHFAEEDDSTDTEKMPEGLSVWNIDEIFADRIEASIDTMSFRFQNKNLTEGVTGHYNHLGNMGSPRISRLYMERRMPGDFIFADPFDFFLIPAGKFYFTNTLSPITNVTYNECGDKTDGEDRITSLFAVNAGKRTGLGFKLDYLYGRGYYARQTTSEFNASLYGSYLSDRYDLHVLGSTDHIKLGENGGILDDKYITNPESMPNSYGSTDIPTVLTKAWTRVYRQSLTLTQRYNLGFYREKGEKTAAPADTADRIKTPADTSATVRRDSTMVTATDTAAAPVQREFVPVTSISHVLKLEDYTHKYIDNKVDGNYYLYKYLDRDSVNDRTTLLKLSNIVSLQVREGFSKWAKAGLAVFLRHELMQYRLPETVTTVRKYSENRLGVGGRLSSQSSKYIKYTAFGEALHENGKWGLFNLRGTMDIFLPIRKDSISLSLKAESGNTRPSFYFRHYHGTNAWWDNDDLKNIFHTRLEASLAYNRTMTNLRFSVENVKNYTYFAAAARTNTGAEGANAMSNGVAVGQHSGNIQIMEATLQQNFRLSIINWENEVTYSLSSENSIIPLPKLSIYSNLYLLFKIARVLTVRAGADVKYFTGYYAPCYVPMIGQFAVQDADQRIKTGNYPLIDVYANFHLKHTRFYVMASHINKSSNGGRYFLVPHYPYNPMNIRFGISWNFFN